MSVIPQNPVLFIGSLRENLDAFGRFRDEELLEALNEIDFMYRFSGENRHGLDTQVSFIEIFLNNNDSSYLL